MVFGSVSANGVSQCAMGICRLAAAAMAMSCESGSTVDSRGSGIGGRGSWVGRDDFKSVNRVAPGRQTQVSTLHAAGHRAIGRDVNPREAGREESKIESGRSAIGWLCFVCCGMSELPPCIPESLSKNYR